MFHSGNRNTKELKIKNTSGELKKKSNRSVGNLLISTENMPPQILSSVDPGILNQMTGCTSLVLSFRHDLKQLKKKKCSVLK